VLIAVSKAVAKMGPTTTTCFDGRVVVKRFEGSPRTIMTEFVCVPGTLAGVCVQGRSCIRVLRAVPTRTSGNDTTWLGSHVQSTQQFTIASIDNESFARHHAELVSKVDVRQTSQLCERHARDRLVDAADFW
jgi:hypothetical protein